MFSKLELGFDRVHTTKEYQSELEHQLHLTSPITELHSNKEELKHSCFKFQVKLTTAIVNDTPLCSENGFYTFITKFKHSVLKLIFTPVTEG